MSPAGFSLGRGSQERQWAGQTNGGEKRFTKGFQVTLILTCSFPGLRTSAPRTVLSLGSTEEFLLTSPSEPTFMCCSTSSESLGAGNGVYGFWNWVVTLRSTHKLFVTNLHAVGTPGTDQLLMFPLSTTRVCSLQDPLQVSLDVLGGVQMMSRPKSRRDFSQRSFWSLMSWNIFLSNLLF